MFVLGVGVVRVVGDGDACEFGDVPIERVSCEEDDVYGWIPMFGYFVQGCVGVCEGFRFGVPFGVVGVFVCLFVCLFVGQRFCTIV